MSDVGSAPSIARSEKGKGSTSVRATKRPRLSDGAPWQRLELFPTPPWATRALFERVLPVLGIGEIERAIWEPAAGLGHMSDVLREFGDVHATDAHIYPLDGGGDASQFGITERDFLAGAADYDSCDWVITNPPFGDGADFLTYALMRAHRGVALLLRLQWLESKDRYADVFTHSPPTLHAQFVERVAMCEGGWDPQCDTATAYSWFIWKKDERFNNGIVPPFSRGFLCAQRSDAVMLDTFLIPPGCKVALTKASDQKLATRCVPGFVPPSVLKKTGKAQARMNFTNA
jgi:hypothetical protein